MQRGRWRPSVVEASPGEVQLGTIIGIATRRTDSEPAGTATPVHGRRTRPSPHAWPPFRRSRDVPPRPSGALRAVAVEGTMTKRWIALTIALAAVLATGCSSGEEPASSDGGTPARGRLRVIATTTQVADFARNVGGDQVQVSSLFKPGVDAHDYEPSPADLEAMARADVVLENGVGLEEWLDDTVKSSGFTGLVVDTSQGVKLRVGGHTEEGEAPAGGDEHDPHIWQNPRNAMVMAANIQRALAEAAPDRGRPLPGQPGRLHPPAPGPGCRGRAPDRQPGQQEAGHQPPQHGHDRGQPQRRLRPTRPAADLPAGVASEG
jgi:Zinc-uptake complex component A periplasmic